MTVMPLMKCGCVATAIVNAPGTPEDGLPVCFPHLGIDPGARVVDDEAPSLEGRRARCSYNHSGAGCPKTPHGGGCCRPGKPGDYGKDPDERGSVASSYDLPFFALDLDAEYDRFFCGCWGWD